MLPTNRVRLPLSALALLAACAAPAPAPERQGAPPGPPAAAAPGLVQPSPPSAQPAPGSAGAAATQRAGDAPGRPPDSLSGPDADRVAELAKKAAPMVDAFLNSSALFTRDGKQLLLVSNRDGLPQLYIADATRPDSPARRLLET